MQLRIKRGFVKQENKENEWNSSFVSFFFTEPKLYRSGFTENMQQM